MGSSPLARGPPAQFHGATARYGLIPARAGTTISASFSRRSARAHPRSRGDHRHSIPIERAFAGSSPLARGPLVTPVWNGIKAGLIPARAGTTADYRRGNRRSRAHPRSRGDHVENVIAPVFTWGSSPLARGPRLDKLANQGEDGLIPARAGTTGGSIGNMCGARAHPRSRGDHRETRP